MTSAYRKRKQAINCPWQFETPLGAGKGQSKALGDMNGRSGIRREEMDARLSWERRLRINIADCNSTEVK